MFIRRNFHEFAAVAWQGYQDHGRGFVLIRRDNPQYFPANKDSLNRKGNLLDGITQFEYVPLDDISNDTEFFTETAENLTDRYDADWEFVTVIERMEEEGWLAYHFVTPVKPKVAFQHFESKITN